MKHLLRGFFIAVLFICCNFQLVLAQPMQTLPVDKNVRIGKLDNGLTYYIRHVQQQWQHANLYGPNKWRQKLRQGLHRQQ